MTAETTKFPLLLTYFYCSNFVKQLNCTTFCRVPTTQGNQGKPWKKTGKLRELFCLASEKILGDTFCGIITHNVIYLHIFSIALHFCCI